MRRFRPRCSNRRRPRAAADRGAAPPSHPEWLAGSQTEGMTSGVEQWIRRAWPRPGTVRSGLAAGFRSCDCLGLPRRRRPPTAEETALRSLDLAGCTVYDIGANVGTFSLFFARQVGGAGQVVAFEPVEETYGKLVANLRINGVVNVRPLRLALGAARGQRAAYAVAGAAGTTSIATSVSADFRYRATTALETAPLDEAAALHSLPPPDFMKIDVEGAEHEVIEGAEGLLRSARPAIFVELHGQGADGKADAAERLAEALARLRYAIYHVETGARVRPGVFAPGIGHWLCRPS